MNTRNFSFLNSISNKTTASISNKTTTTTSSSFLARECAIVRGIRDLRFKILIENLLKLAHLKPAVVDKLLEPQSLKLYEQAFTHKSANAKINYEYLEFLGDAVLNKAIPWYLTRKFPKLCQTDGVKILARLKINLVSSKVFGNFASRLNFLEFISADEFTRTDKPDKLLEDCFEAVFGATELLVDKHIGMNTGYGVCYTIIGRLLDNIDIDLRYTALFDPKTRLKEIFDAFGGELGVLKFQTDRSDGVNENTVDGVVVSRVHTSRVYRIFDKKWILLGEGTHILKIDAEQIAAEIAIGVLNAQGYVKEVPWIYKEIEREYCRK